MTLHIWPMVLLVAVAHGVQTAAGFGAGLILVTLGAHFLELPTLLALLLPLSIAQTGWIAVRHRSAVDVGVLLWRVLPWMGSGLGVGYLVSAQLAGMAVVKQALGVLVVGLAGRELWRVQHSAPPAAGTPLASIAAIFGAGMVHGIYATGGPLLVYGLGREGLDRARFRATVSVVWLVLNIVLVATFAAEGRYTASLLQQLAALFMGVPVGIIVGERIFAGVSERTFKLGIYSLLLLAGIPLMFG